MASDNFKDRIKVIYDLFPDLHKEAKEIGDREMAKLPFTQEQVYNFFRTLSEGELNVLINKAAEKAFHEGVFFIEMMAGDILIELFIKTHGGLSLIKTEIPDVGQVHAVLLAQALSRELFRVMVDRVQA